ncbi:acetate--CoA ligase [bacterium CPR1]|nr:acetate--CoA ligase [bacterium CPR1]
MERTLYRNPDRAGFPPNLTEQERERFSWEAVASELEGGPGLNLGWLATDRHLPARAERLAFRFQLADGSRQELTCAELSRQTARFANLLGRLGIEPGQTVASLAARIPGLYLAVLGTLKKQAAFSPLFSAFGPEPIHQRLSRGHARVLLTTRRLYEKKVAALRERLPELEWVLLADAEEDLAPTVLSLSKALAKESDEFEVAFTDPETPSLLHFTSGTTGMPKGAVHVHRACLTHFATGRYALDLHDQDVYWCTADPGWVTGTSYGILSPLLHGVSCIVDEPDFDPDRWYRTLAEQKVTVWYTAPTAIRMLMRLPLKPREVYDLSALRLVASVGEPLNPEAVVWGQETLGLPIHDNWWQTETGGIMIANTPGQEIRPGSMGRPLPGVEAAIVQRTSPDAVEPVADDEEGELALKPGWPSMFRAYLAEEERYRRCFVGGWYISGDLARRDKDGYFWFVGRADDIIKTAGHMVGPFEVESALMEHPAVAEAGVIGKPDPVIGEVVKAFVSLKPGHPADEDTRRDLLGFGRKRLGSAVAPKEIEFLEVLPRTRSGKIMRRLLKARELGLPEGDLSTLEGAP